MQLVPNYIELDITAKDVVKESTFKVAFKLLEVKTARKVLKRLYNSNYTAQCAILVSNIVYISQLADSKGNLTNSFENSIIKELLQSMPYFQSILGNFVTLLHNVELVQRRSLQEQNLFNAGKWQYEIDYGKQDQESKEARQTEHLQETMGSFMSFEEEPEVDLFSGEVISKETKVEELAKLEELPNLLWSSNVPFLRIFNIAKFHQNEWGLLNPVVLIELAKEFELKCSDVLTFVPIVKAGYESMKPKDET